MMDEPARDTFLAPPEGPDDTSTAPPPRPVLPSSRSPDIRLFGSVNASMLAEFFRQQAAVPAGAAVVFELSTPGGDADMGRRIAEELRLWQDEGREIFFLGKTHVFSAGVTIMASVPPDHRFLTFDTELLIHERKMQQSLVLDGALRACRATVQNLMAEIDSGQRLENDDFTKLVAGTGISLQKLSDQVMDRDWYLSARQAHDLGLIGGVV